MRKNTSLVLLVLLMQMSFALAQTQTIDSLKHLLQNERQDSTRSLLLSQLSRAYLNSKPDTALLLAQQGLALARSIQFIPGEISGLKETGNVFLNTGNNAKALEIFLRALKKCENTNDRKWMSSILSSIGIVYQLLGDYQKQRDYLLQAKEIAIDLHDDYRLMVITINLGNCYEKLNRLDSARLYTNQGYDLAIKQHNTSGIGISLNNLGNIYSKMGQPEVAMANYRLSIPVYMQDDDDDGICETSIGMANLFRQQGKDDSCLHYAKLSFTLAQKAGFIQRVLDAGNFLADYYREHKVVDSAYSYLYAVIAAKDSIFSQEKTKEIQNLSFDETIRQQEISSTKVAEEKERNHNIQFAVIAVALISFTIIFLLLSRSILVNEKWIRFLGVLGLLLVFEFLNILMHPFIAAVTHESPLYTLLVLVVIAALLIPLHHRLEHWIKEKVVEKNKKIRLAAAKRTVAQLEGDENLHHS